MKPHDIPSTAVQVAAPNDVRGALTFIVPQETKPYFESSALTGGLPKVYFDTENHYVDVHDMRRIVDGLSLDQHGFVLISHETAVVDLHDDAAIAEVYDRELVELVKRATGADRVSVFDHTRRSDTPDGAVNRDGPRAPADRCVRAVEGARPARRRAALPGGTR